MWRGLSCVKVAGRRRKSPQKKKKRAQRPTDHRMHLNWFIKAPQHPPHPAPLSPPAGSGFSSPSPSPELASLFSNRPPRSSLLLAARAAPRPRRGRLLFPHPPVNPIRPPATVERPCGEPQPCRASIEGCGDRVRLRVRTGVEYARYGRDDILLIAPTPSAAP